MSNIMDAMNNNYEPVALEEDESLVATQIAEGLSLPDVPPPRMTMEGVEELRRILDEQFRNEVIVVEQGEPLSEQEIEEMLNAQTQPLYEDEPECDTHMS
jgi:hypothetical protein